MSGWDFRPTGDIVYRETRGDETFEAWIYLPRIGEAKKIDEYAAELADRRADLQAKVDDFRTLYNRTAELRKIIAARTEKRDGLAAVAETGDEQADLAAIDEDIARLQAELDDKTAELEGSAEDSAELLGEFNRRIADDSLAWLVNVTRICGDGNWPTDPDMFPVAARTTGLVGRIKDHWGQVPLASTG